LEEVKIGNGAHEMAEYLKTIVNKVGHPVVYL